jgi:hypothetical protein
MLFSSQLEGELNKVQLSPFLCFLVRITVDCDGFYKTGGSKKISSYDTKKVDSLQVQLFKYN